MNDLNPVSQLLATCDSLGIRLLPDVDGGLSIDAPQDALTPELLQQLVANKVDLLAHLAAEHSQTQTPTSATGSSNRGLPLRFDDLARCAHSRRAVNTAGLRPLWAVYRLLPLVRRIALQDGE